MNLRKKFTFKMSKYKFKCGPQSEKDISLWNDPRWKNAEKNLSEEQLKQYRNIGEQMIASIDFVTGISNDIPIPKPAADSINYILTGLRSGLEPEDLEDNELETLRTFLGEDWMDKIYTNATNDDKKQENSD